MFRLHVEANTSVSFWPTMDIALSWNNEGFFYFEFLKQSDCVTDLLKTAGYRTLNFAFHLRCKQYEMYAWEANKMLANFLTFM